MSDGLVVTGGADGIEARTEDLRAAARLLSGAAGGIESVAGACAGPLARADPGFAGPAFTLHLQIRGVIAAVAALATDLRRVAHALDAAASGYEDTDRSAIGMIWDGLTSAVSTTVRLELAPLTFAAAWGRSGDAATAGWTVLDDNLEVLDLGMNALLTSLPGLSILLDLQAVPDGSAQVLPTGPDSRGAAARAPRSLADLIAGLARRNEGPHGAVDVRILTGADGRRRAVVDITGTKSWSLRSPDVTNLTTNARALIGRDTAYEEGVFEALRQAGVRPGEEVMLVGHSQGGMIAVNVARDAAGHGFDVTHVITAGSPIGLTAAQVPRGVQMLALENRRDAVPRVDGLENPDRVNLTTVTFDSGPSSPLDAHSLERSYLPATSQLDASANPAIRSFLDSASGYFSAREVNTHTFTITRRY